MKPALLILAAGMGSRYGGLKQLDPMGPNGETVLDYSAQDAARAGFGKVVFVIRRDFAGAFRERIGSRIPAGLEARYCLQVSDDLPDHFSPPPGRSKPWGTAHAVRAARGEISEPFAVINADDFYGRDAFVRLAGWAEARDPEQLAACMIGYPLRNTLSEHGSVNRGICRTRDGLLESIEEHTGIAAEGNGRVRGTNAVGETVVLDPAAPVSMNFWGFTPPLFEALEARFRTFISEHGHEEQSECYLPAVVDDLIHRDGLACPVLETDAGWFGVTYPDDKPRVMAGIRALIDAGEYPGFGAGG